MYGTNRRFRKQFFDNQSERSILCRQLAVCRWVLKLSKVFFNKSDCFLHALAFNLNFKDIGHVSIRCYGDEKLKVWHIHSLYVRTYLPIIVLKKLGLDAMKIKATMMLPFVFCAVLLCPPWPSKCCHGVWKTHSPWLPVGKPNICAVFN